MAKLETLTAEQERQIPIMRDFWLNYILSCKNSLDKDKARKGIEWLYEFSGKKKPAIIFMDSPFGCQVAANFFKTFLKNKANIRANIGYNIGANIRDNIRDNIGANIGANIRDNIGANIRDNIGANIRDNIGANIWDNIRDNIGANIEANIEDNIRANIWDNIRDNIGANIGANIRDNKLEHFPTGWAGTIGNFGWVAYIDYFLQLQLIHTDREKDFNAFKELLLSGIFDMIQLDGLCIVSSLPTIIIRNSSGRLHNPAGPSVEFNDGWCQHNINGRALPAWIWEKATAGEITKEIFLKENNSEIKGGIYEVMGQKKMMELLGAVAIDTRTITHKNGDLETVILLKTSQRFAEINNQPFAWVSMVCPSTGSQYLQGVEPHHKNALEAIASLSPFKPEEYSFDMRS